MTKPKEIKSPAKCEVPDDAEIDEALAETFPASDPPPWTLGVESHCHPEEADREGDTVNHKPEP